MKQAIILGCSHAAGAEMYQQQHTLTACDQDELGARNSYPVLLAEMLGYQAQNHAISGGSNDAMFRVLLDIIDNLDSTDIVVACWTGYQRAEIWYEPGQYWIPLNYGNGHSHSWVANTVLKQGRCVHEPISDHQHYEAYGKQWLMFEGNQQRGRVNKIRNVMALNNLAHSKGIKVINIESFASVDNYAWPTSIYRPLGNQEFGNFCLDRQFAHTKNGHFFRPAHQAFAEHILQQLNWKN